MMMPKREHEEQPDAVTVGLYETSPGDDQRTVGVFGRQSGKDFVTGWLVCVKGPNKGMDFRIHSQNNHIGRAKHMDICIPGDPTISSERAATLIYDYKGKKFLIAAGTGLTLTYLNGEIVTGSAILKAYDVINIGDTDLLFIPLCGEQFDWKNV